MLSQHLLSRPVQLWSLSKSKFNDSITSIDETQQRHADLVANHMNQSYTSHKMRYYNSVSKFLVRQDSQTVRNSRPTRTMKSVLSVHVNDLGGTPVLGYLPMTKRHGRRYTSELQNSKSQALLDRGPRPFVLHKMHQTTEGDTSHDQESEDEIISQEEGKQYINQEGIHKTPFTEQDHSYLTIKMIPGQMKRPNRTLRRLKKNREKYKSEYCAQLTPVQKSKDSLFSKTFYFE